MKDFKTSLVREKFTINKTGSHTPPIIALSNRLCVNLTDKDGQIRETFIVRSQNMHLCTRMAARILQTYIQLGPITSRHKDYDWGKVWKALVNDYERLYNPDRWIAIYHEGKAVYSGGDHHPFFDLIEKCDAENDDEYDLSVALAEQAFLAKGQNIKIDYDANVALVINFEATHGRSSIILRGPDRTTTFTYSAAAKEDRAFNFAQCLSAGAAFLEGIQMAFMVGMNEEKIRLGLIERHSDEEKQHKEAQSRLRVLNSELTNFETSMTVHYRPEKPEFYQIIVDAEALAQKMFAPEDEESI